MVKLVDSNGLEEPLQLSELLEFSEKFSNEKG